MKRRIFFAVILIIAAAIAGRYVSRMKNADASTRDEKRQSFRLEPGARVEVRGINGSVEVSTAETNTADVHIVRTANDPGDLDYRKVVVEYTPTSLVVRGEGDKGGWWRRLWGGVGEVRQQVALTLPRRVELTAKGVNGPVGVGEVDGPVEVSGVNGRVEVAQSVGHSEIKGVNGSVKIGVSQLGAQGMGVKGVNGGVEIRLRENLNADISVKGHHGNLTLNVPNITTEEREGFGNVRVRLGAGGAPIDIKGVNGNVRFESGASSATVPGGDSLPVPPPPPPAPR